MNIQKALIAGGTGLLLGITSMSSFSRIPDPYASVDPAQQLADGLSDVCITLQMSGEEFLNAIDKGANEVWTNLYDTSYIADGDEAIANTISNIESKMSTHAASAGCKDVTCTFEIFNEGLTSTPDSGHAITFAGGQEDGDAALVCTVNPISATDSCNIGAMNGVTFLMLPVSKRLDETVYGLHPNGLKYRAKTKASEWELAIVIPKSGTAEGISERAFEKMLVYLTHGSRCGSSNIKPIHNGNATSTFVSTNRYWTPYP